MVRRWFFAVAAGLILAIVLVAFAPTLYLRGLFVTPPIPSYLYVHGALLTTWFLLLFIQTVLVAARHTRWHRPLGVFGVAVAVLLVPVSAVVVMRAVPRFLASGMTSDHIAGAVVGDLISLLVFAGLVAAAVRLRGRPEAHKRLMLIASTTLIGPALSRLAERGLLTASLLSVLIASVVVLSLYDLITNRRPHEATIWGGIAAVGGIVLAGNITRSGDAVVAAFLPPRSIQSIQPVFRVANVRRTADWYRDVLGFATLAMADVPDPPAAIVMRDGVQIMLQRSGVAAVVSEPRREDAAVGWRRRHSPGATATNSCRTDRAHCVRLPRIRHYGSGRTRRARQRMPLLTVAHPSSLESHPRRAVVSCG